MKAKTFRYALLFTLSLLLTGVFSEVTAQPRMRFKANKVIRRTAIVLHAAHKQLKINKQFTGNFAKAIAHQRFARRQYMRGNFRSAIHHSRRARMLARMVIQDNKGMPPKEAEFTGDENAGGKDNPTDTELDAELIKDNPNLKFSDEELMDA